MSGPAEREVQRLGRRCAAVLRTSVAAFAGIVAFVVAPSVPTLVAVVAVNAWSLCYARLMFRSAGTWLLAADTAVVCVACLTERWTAPPDAPAGTTSWVVALTSIAVATWQWHRGARPGWVATAAVVLAYLAGAGLTSTTVFFASWLVVEAVLSRGLFLLVRKGARDADRIMADAERTRRDATIAAARRADEREHLAAMHDTAAAVLLAIGAGTVDGREPWLATQLADAVAEVTGGTTTPQGQADLVPLLDDVVRHGPVTADLSATSAAPLPAVAAVAICRSVREALRNVARHAGVDTATVRVEHEAGHTVVEVADHGRGFDPALVPPHRRGIALSLVDRMAAVGGRAEVTSGSGRGTRVRLEWPNG